MEFDKLTKIEQYVIVTAVGKNTDLIEKIYDVSPNLEIKLIVNGIELDFSQFVKNIEEAWNGAIENEAKKQALKIKLSSMDVTDKLYGMIDELKNSIVSIENAINEVEMK
jgi:hypothetical protein